MQQELCSTHDDLQKKEQKPALTDHAPSGTLNEVTESGWIDSTSLMKFIKHFVTHLLKQFKPSVKHNGWS